MTKTKISLVVFAQDVCTKLENEDWYHETIPLIEACGGDRANYFYYQKSLKRLERLGVLSMIGQKKFKWRLANKAYNRDNPFNTEKSKSGTGMTGRVGVGNSRILIEGDTFEHKEQLKGIGCKWDSDVKAWWLPKSEITKLHSLIDNYEEVYDAIGGYQPEPPVVTPQVVTMQPDIELLDRIETLEATIKRLLKTQRTEIVLKQKDQDPVVISGNVHPIFEQVLFHIGCGDNVMLVGPKGCGKTYLAEQIAKTLKRKFDFIALSGGVTEGKLFGRVTPNITTGKQEYQTTPFVDLFENGGVFLLDEVDAADPNVLLSLNSGLANGKLTIERAKKPNVTRHKTFTCLAAANTWGTGADRQYVGRNQQDSAFTERFVQIEMGYDEALEMTLCPGAEEMVSTLHKWRANITANRLERTISTRFICRAFNWLQHGKDMSYVEAMLFAGWRADEVRKTKGS